MRLDRANGCLRDDAGRRFVAASREWSAAAGPAGGEPVTPEEAATWLQRESGAPCRAPVGVIGPRQATAEQCGTAERLGEGLARLGLVVLCGGRQGVMEAACRGVAAAGGISVGVLPDDDWTAANRFVTIPVATGLGVARNAIVARAALCLVAVGGGHGTLSEIAFGLQFGRPVFALADTPAVPGVRVLQSAEEALAAVARVLLNLD
ncbi:MAG: TIGR00725 family protein [Alphaproteobacteria bacterium]